MESSPDGWVAVKPDKNSGDWFDVAADEDVVAAHDSDTDASSDTDDDIIASAAMPDMDDELPPLPPPLGDPAPLSGVFYHTPAGAPVYAPFPPDLRRLLDPALSFLPEPVAVHASAAGLLCCRGRDTRLYYVCNPLTADWTVLPASTNDHGDAVAVVLVPDSPAADAVLEYSLVCAHAIVEDGVGFFKKGIYGVECFDSRRWAWTASLSIIDADKEKIVPESGMAGGGAAYWRTEMGTVVLYVPATDELLVTVPPGSPARWELGELGGRLCCTTVEGTSAVVWVLDEVDRWTEERSMEVGPDWRVLCTDDLPSPLRSQGGRELLFWEGKTWCHGRHVVARDMETARARRLIDDSPEPGDALVPYVCSLVQFKSKKIDREGQEDEGGKKSCPPEKNTLKDHAGQVDASGEENSLQLIGDAYAYTEGDGSEEVTHRDQLQKSGSPSSKRKLDEGDKLNEGDKLDDDGIVIPKKRPSL